jgi:SAM-dependent methyltransferase
MGSNFLQTAYRRLWVLPRTQKTYRSLSVAETFQRIYRTKSWGDNGTPFSSGGGSRGPITDQYCSFIAKFVAEHDVRSIVDLGCGDFSVGSKIVEGNLVDYTGVDVVPELISYHQERVTNPRVRFQCADITADKLPTADLCLIRQVLQHLSNDEIQKVLTNVRSFPRVLISEDVPVRPKKFNRDKPHGPDVRRYYNSGVWPEHPPFREPVAQAWELQLDETSILRTVLIDRTGVTQ